MSAHLRVIVRQPVEATSGKLAIVQNDGLEVVDDTGEVIADLSKYVRRIDVLSEIGGARRFRIEALAGEVRVETETPA